MSARCCVRDHARGFRVADSPGGQRGINDPIAGLAVGFRARLDMAGWFLIAVDLWRRWPRRYRATTPAAPDRGAAKSVGQRLALWSAERNVLPSGPPPRWFRDLDLP